MRVPPGGNWSWNRGEKWPISHFLTCLNTVMSAITCNFWMILNVFPQKILLLHFWNFIWTPFAQNITCSLFCGSASHTNSIHLTFLTHSVSKLSGLNCWKRFFFVFLFGLFLLVNHKILITLFEQVILTLFNNELVWMVGKTCLY